MGPIIILLLVERGGSEVCQQLTTHTLRTTRQFYAVRLAHASQTPRLSFPQYPIPNTHTVTVLAHARQDLIYMVVVLALGHTDLLMVTDGSVATS